MRRKWHVICLVICCSILFLMGCGKKQEEFQVEGIENIFLEVGSGNEIKEIVLDELDETEIKELLCEAAIVPDEDFVFAEGKVRIRVEGGTGATYLYPYIEDVSMFRVGHEGDLYIWLDEDMEDRMEEVLEKYVDFDMYEGIFDWKSEVANDDILEEQVTQVLRVQYGWARFSSLKKFSTEEFARTVDRDEIYIGRRFYTIDSVVYEENSNGDEVTVVVGVYSPDIMFHYLTFEKTEDGTYLLNDISNDI